MSLDTITQLLDGAADQASSASKGLFDQAMDHFGLSGKFSTDMCPGSLSDSAANAIHSTVTGDNAVIACHTYAKRDCKANIQDGTRTCKAPGAESFFGGDHTFPMGDCTQPYFDKGHMSITCGQFA